MSIADDLRAAARWIDDSCGERTEIGDGLRAHADLLERMEGQMRENVTKRFSQWTLTKRWADAISTGSLE